MRNGLFLDVVRVCAVLRLRFLRLLRFFAGGEMTQRIFAFIGSSTTNLKQPSLSHLVPDPFASDEETL
jgi:hypothetical protein